MMNCEILELHQYTQNKCYPVKGQHDLLKIVEYAPHLGYCCMQSIQFPQHLDTQLPGQAGDSWKHETYNLFRAH